MLEIWTFAERFVRITANSFLPQSLLNKKYLYKLNPNLESININMSLPCKFPTKWCYRQRWLKFVSQVSISDVVLAYHIALKILKLLDSDSSAYLSRVSTKTYSKTFKTQLQIYSINVIITRFYLDCSALIITTI